MEKNCDMRNILPDIFCGIGAKRPVWPNLSYNTARSLLQN